MCKITALKLKKNKKKTAALFSFTTRSTDFCFISFFQVFYEVFKIFKTFLFFQDFQGFYRDSKNAKCILKNKSEKDYFSILLKAKVICRS